MPLGDYEEEPTPAELARYHIENILNQGVSQRELSRLTEFPRSTLGDFLRGTHEPTEATINRLLDALEGFI